MATPYALRSFAGGAQVTTLASVMQITDISFSLTAASGWSNLGGANGNFWVEIDPGLPTDEKILCSALSGLVVTCVGRGGGSGDGSGAAQHQSGATVRLIHASQDDSEANALVHNLGNAAAGAILLGGGAATLPTALALGANGKYLVSNGTAPVYAAHGSDTGWVSLSLNTGFSGSRSTTPAYRQIDNKVYLRGSIATTSGFTTSSPFTAPTPTPVQEQSWVVGSFWGYQNLDYGVTQASTWRWTYNTNGIYEFSLDGVYYLTD